LHYTFAIAPLGAPMPWLVKKTHTYFYKSVREGGRVRSVYRGRGVLGAAEALLIDGRRADAEARRAERERLDAEERSADDLFGRVEMVARAALAAAGFHRHKGQWRRRRVSKPKTTSRTKAGVPATAGKAKPPARKAPPPAPRGPREPLTRGEAQDLADRISDGDASLMPEWNAYLDNEGSKVLAEIGSARMYAEGRAVADIAGDNPAIREALRRRIVALRRELAGASPSPLERLLVERVVHCWLKVYQYERVADGGASYAEAEYRQRCVDRASRRFLAACKTLATVRRLALPDAALTLVQQNIDVAIGADGARAIAEGDPR
jgi:hypothetical protein